MESQRTVKIGVPSCAISKLNSIISISLKPFSFISYTSPYNYLPLQKAIKKLPNKKHSFFPKNVNYLYSTAFEEYDTGFIGRIRLHKLKHSTLGLR